MKVWGVVLAIGGKPPSFTHQYHSYQTFLLCTVHPVPRVALLNIRKVCGIRLRMPAKRYSYLELLPSQSGLIPQPSRLENPYYSVCLQSPPISRATSRWRGELPIAHLGERHRLWIGCAVCFLPLQHVDQRVVATVPSPGPDSVAVPMPHLLVAPRRITGQPCFECGACRGGDYWDCNAQGRVARSSCHHLPHLLIACRSQRTIPRRDRMQEPSTPLSTPRPWQLSKT